MVNRHCTCIKEPCYNVEGLCNVSGLFNVAGLFDIVCCTRFFMSHLGKKLNTLCTSQIITLYLY